VNIAARSGPSAAQIVLDYHARTKHRLEAYARGPETLDWDAQPNPFREFAGCERLTLPFAAMAQVTLFDAIATPHAVAPAPPNSENVAALLELSFGLSAWKEYGPDRWALRCNPSSGNLHPTEAYVLVRGVSGLNDGLYHYMSRDHVLERRAQAPGVAAPAARLFIGLSSVHWREAWKYGERAFRYCQLDIGHALGALRYAAGTLGWRLVLCDALDAAALANLLGLDRDADFANAEREEADLLAEIVFAPTTPVALPAPIAAAEPAWQGQANRLDPRPMYHWPIIDTVSRASRRLDRAEAEPVTPPAYPPQSVSGAGAAAPLILHRRSAQHFDARFTLPRADFHHLLDAVLPRQAAPWDIWAYRPRLHLLLFVHRVEGLAPGIYVMPRAAEADALLRQSLDPAFAWEKPEGTPAALPLFRLASGDFRKARTLHCHQAIASDGCLALGMLAEFAPIVEADPWRYRQLHWEAGLIGHVLYLQAEALGHRATGIGCYFDDAFHALIGVKSSQLQSLYHLALGRPLTDARITTLPAYVGRSV
jgi:SagB-type dehydrogenase family enzyme